MYNFNKSDYEILMIIYTGGYNDSFNSITTAELIDQSVSSSSKVRLAISNFIRAGFVAEGFKDSNSKTYYITEEGRNHFRSVYNRNNSEESNKEEQ